MTPPTMPDVAKWITIAEAAQQLGVNEKTIRRAVQRGQIRSQRIPFDRRIYVDAEQVAAMRQQRESIDDEEDDAGPAK